MNNNNNSNPGKLLPWLLALVLVEQVGLYGATAYATGGDNAYLVLSMAAYMAVGWLVTRVLRIRDDVGMVNLIWNVFSTLLALLMGALLFGETLTTWKQTLGVCLGVVSLALVS